MKKYLMYAALAALVLVALSSSSDPTAAIAAGAALAAPLEIVAHGLDRGTFPARFVQHLYRMVGQKLYHFTDGDLRAVVPPEGYLDFLVDHVDARPLWHQGDMTKASDLEAKCHERMFSRMRELLALRSKATGPDQVSIDERIGQAVDEALKRYTEILKRAGLLDADGQPIVASVVAPVGPSNPQAAGATSSPA